MATRRRKKKSVRRKVIPMRASDLEVAIRAAGGVKGLARKLHDTSVASINRWRRKGIPKRGSAREELLKYKQERRTSRKAETADLKILRALLKKARDMAPGLRKANRHAEAVSVAKTGEKRMAGRVVVGYSWTRVFNRQLTYTLIDDIEAWAANKRRRSPKFNLWSIVAITSLFSRTEDFLFPKSGNTIDVQVDLTYGNQFVAEQPFVSTREKNKKDALMDLRGLLEAQLEMSTATIFVTSVELNNYRFKTVEERRAHETAYRKKNKLKKEREEQWKKKKKKSRKKSSQKVKISRKKVPRKRMPRKKI